MAAVAPFTEKTGTAAAFVSADGGLDVQPGLIDYVTNFSTVAAGKKFNPHVTIGIAPEVYLNEMLAEPFKPFMFSPVARRSTNLAVLVRLARSFTHYRRLPEHADAARLLTT